MNRFEMETEQNLITGKLYKFTFSKEEIDAEDSFWSFYTYKIIWNKNYQKLEIITENFHTLNQITNNFTFIFLSYDSFKINGKTSNFIKILLENKITYVLAYFEIYFKILNE